VAGTPSEHAAEARAALNAIVSDPTQGVSVLSSGRSTANVLKDLLPDAPREAALLAAAAEQGVADALRERVSQGMDIGTAVRLSATAFADATAYTPEACDWAVSEIAIALRLSSPTGAATGIPPSQPQSPPVGDLGGGAPQPPGSSAETAAGAGQGFGYGPAAGWPPPADAGQAGQGGQFGQAPGWPAPATEAGRAQYPPPSGWPQPPDAGQAGQGGQYQQAAGWPQSPPAAAAQPGQYQQASGWPQPSGAGAGQGVQNQPTAAYVPGSWPASGGGTAPQAPPGPPGWQTGPPGMPPPPAKRKNTALIAIIAGVAVVAIAAVAIFLVSSNNKTTPPPPPVKPPVVSISASSTAGTVPGYVFVYYADGNNAQATISSSVSSAAKGQVAKLTAQPFPFQSPPAVIDTTKITGKSQPLSYTVTPSLATRYQIEVFGSSSASKPLAKSSVQTVYVGLLAHSKIVSDNCPRPDCFVTLHVDEHAPASVIQTESNKHLYQYFRVKLSPGAEPSIPKTLYLQSHPPAPTVQILSSNEYQLTISFSFHIGQDADHWSWNACTKDDEPSDGVGLPGHHGCGDPTLSSSYTGYLG
jgi:hypothetical protein